MRDTTSTQTFSREDSENIDQINGKLMKAGFVKNCMFIFNFTIHEKFSDP